MRPKSLACGLGRTAEAGVPLEAPRFSDAAWLNRQVYTCLASLVEGEALSMAMNTLRPQLGAQRVIITVRTLGCARFFS